jgi:hypothetical protein
MESNPTSSLEKKNEEQTKIINLQKKRIARLTNKTPYLNKATDWLEIKIGKFINILIIGFFKICIIGGILFAIFNFSSDLFHSLNSDTKHNISHKIVSEFKDLNLSENQTIKIEDVLEENIDLLSKAKSQNHDLALLSFIEHIFIYLIPVLIFLGLYFYYRINYQPRFTTTKDYGDAEISKSKDSIQLTKTLFLTSIMSYVIIKIIEKLFLSSDEELNFIEVFSYGMFLFLIMFYLIHSHKNHK